MKTCPTCQTQFDDSMRFCLEDGTPLVASATDSLDQAETETLVVPADTNPKATEAVTEQLSARTDPEVATETFPEETSTASPEARPTRADEVRPTDVAIAGEPRRTGRGLIFGGAMALGALLLVGTLVGGVWWFSGPTNPELAAVATNQPANLTVNDPGNPANDGFSNISEPNTEVTNAANSETKPTPTAAPKRDATRTPEQAPEPTPAATPKPTPSPRPTQPDPPKRISAGVVNGRATSLPQPDYPPAARRAKASGSVSVRVLIDENGRVTSAQAISGHRLLRSSAVSAARRARFQPTRVNRQPVEVTGVLVYNFRP